MVGGIDKVFEVNRNFRNEGVDSSHSPEFAMLETYEAWGDYNTGMRTIRELIQAVAMEVFGSHVVTLVDGTEYDLGGEWPEIEMYPSLNEALQRKYPGQPEVTIDSTVEELKQLADVVGLEVPAKGGWGHGKLVEEIWEVLCEDQLTGPIFVKDFPVETSPLTRQHRTKPGVTEKWDLYVRGLSWPPATPSWWTRSSSVSASRTRPVWPPAVTMRRWSSTRTSSLPWSRACRRPPASAWVLTACSWP